MAYLGDPDTGERVLAPLRGFGRPLLDGVTVRPYTALQSMVDASAPRGWHYYAKSLNLPALHDDIIDVMVNHAWQANSPRSYVSIYHLGGAVSHEDLADHERTWARGVYQALAPYEAGVSINFLDRDDRQRFASAYPNDTFGRLIEVKGRYDPDNVFPLNSHVITANHDSDHAAPRWSRGKRDQPDGEPETV